MEASPGTALRIALLAPPMLPVPPPSYAGTERVVAALADALVQRGHDVTLIAPGDSTWPGRVVPTVENSLWRSGYRGETANYIAISVATAWAHANEFDLIHSHVETLGFLLARHAPVPVVSTLHGRLDAWGVPDLLETFRDIPLVAISDSQRRWQESANWVATIHHGLPLEHMPFGAEPGSYLAFVGRIAPEKGVDDAIELATETRLPLRMAAKVYDGPERELFDAVVEPAIRRGAVEFLGELEPLERDPLYAGALATVMLGAWPEPFGLVAIESLATGTPVIARRAGALTETIEHGVDGFLVDDLMEAKLAVERVADLDRAAIRWRALERFSPDRMAREYEAVYRTLLEEQDRRPGAREPRREPAASGAAG
jgi:glycosyltransferase involved in cell wall biosynthesis